MKKPKQPSRLIRRLVVVTLAIAAGALPMLMPQWMTSLAAYGYNPGYFKLSAYGYQVNENNGPAIITVQRAGGSDGAVSVDCATSDGTAEDGFDYIGILTTLSWLGGDADDKECYVPIINDNVSEADEDFVVSIGNPTGGAQLGSSTDATVTILDDDTATLTITTIIPQKIKVKVKKKLKLDGVTYIFDKWSGDCSGTKPNTTVKLDSDKNCAAEYLPK